MILVCVSMNQKLVVTWAASITLTYFLSDQCLLGYVSLSASVRTVNCRLESEAMWIMLAELVSSSLGQCLHSSAMVTIIKCSCSTGGGAPSTSHSDCVSPPPQCPPKGATVPYRPSPTTATMLLAGNQVRGVGEGRSSELFLYM